MHRLWLLLLAVLFVSETPAAAQFRSGANQPSLELSFGFTTMSRGPGGGSERAMQAIGFHPGSGEQSTRTSLDGFWKIEIGVSRHRSLGIMTTRVRNHTYGVRRDSGRTASIDTRHTVVTRAVTWSYRPSGWLSVGAGPALHKRRFAIRTDGPDAGVRSERGLGAVAGINVKFKRDNGAFMHALWQYRYAGSLRSSAVELPLPQARGAAEEYVQWPARSIPFSHRMLGIGFGLEF